MAWSSTGLNIKGPQGDEGPQGPKGDDGRSVTIKGTVANASLLPATGIEVGDGYITADTGHLWVKGDAEWSDVGTVRGPEGPQGPKGDTGTAGADGDDGQDGRGVSSASVNGSGNLVLTYTDSATQDVGHVKGPQGDTGTQGLKGDTGATGTTGTRGSAWNVGSGAPGTISGTIVGDMYLDASTGEIWKYQA